MIAADAIGPISERTASSPYITSRKIIKQASHEPCYGTRYVISDRFVLNRVTSPTHFWRKIRVDPLVESESHGRARPDGFENARRQGGAAALAFSIAIGRPHIAGSRTGYSITQPNKSR